MQQSLRRLRRSRSVTTTAALACLVTAAGIASAVSPASAKGTATPQVIAFPSRDFVSVAEPAGSSPTTTWTHLGATTQTSTSKVPGVAPDLGLNDINHAGAPCWSTSLTPPTSDMAPGDRVTVTGPTGVTPLAMTVADVTTDQAHLAPGSTTRVLVTGSASDPVTHAQLAAGLLQVRLVAKKQAFALNGRRDLRALLGGGKDGVLNYNTPGSATDMSFTASFTLSGTDVALATGAQTRGIVQDDPVNPTTITIFEKPQAGDGVVHGNAAGCPVP